MLMRWSAKLTKYNRFNSQNSGSIESRISTLDKPCTSSNGRRSPSFEPPPDQGCCPIIKKTQRRTSRLTRGQRRGMITYEKHIKRLNWPTHGNFQTVPLSLLECYRVVFGSKNLILNLLFKLTEYKSQFANLKTYRISYINEYFIVYR